MLRLAIGCRQVRPFWPVLDDPVVERVGERGMTAIDRRMNVVDKPFRRSEFGVTRIGKQLRHIEQRDVMFRGNCANRLLDHRCRSQRTDIKVACQAQPSRGRLVMFRFPQLPAQQVRRSGMPRIGGQQVFASLLSLPPRQIAISDALPTRTHRLARLI